MARTILIAAGGTGGHLFPGIAVADELVRRDRTLRVVFVGTPRGLESRLVPRSGYELALLPIRPLKAVGPARLALGLVSLPWAMARALGLVVRIRPSAVLGIGGYAGGPVTLLGALLGVRTVILEPNARPGFTNRVLCPFVGRAACAYDETRAYFGTKGVVTGNPVRGGFAQLGAREPRHPLSLLVFGGSQGSRALNRAMVAALPHLPGPERLRIVHQTGERMREEVASAYETAGRKTGVEIVAFLDDMVDRMAGADLVLSRSGATTCAELTVAGRAAVLVPFAQAADDHQRTNAKALEDAGAARMIEEKDLTGETLARALTALVDEPSRIAAMAEAARRLGRPDAAARVADLVLGDGEAGVEAC
jgi:UDP-N-acetylglucosamine--N-acetylmuramyl-(pentapeptide) pyrophosphoryl-undecaprenol N-acetylglucosamine transferase